MKPIVVAVLLAACGTDPVRIDLAMPGTQVLVTEKVNSGPWQKLSGQFDGETNKTTYSVEIGDEYELVAVCLRSGPTDAGQFDAAQLFGTSEDAELTLASWQAPDCRHDGSGNAEPSGDPVTVTGTFDETMDLSIGTQKVHVTGGYGFSIASRTGRHDLIASSNTKVLIERDLEVTGDGVLDPIDIGRDGTSMLSAATDLTGDPDEGVPFVYNYLFTRNQAAFVWSDPATQSALFVPPSLLAPDDSQVFWVRFGTPTRYRAIAVEDPRHLDKASLLPRITSATAHTGILGMTWTPISVFYTSAAVTARPAKGSWQSVTASRLWLERHGKNTLEFDPAIDGYDPSWSTTAEMNVQISRFNSETYSVTTSGTTEAM